MRITGAKSAVTALEFLNVDKHYGQTRALNDVTLQVVTGEIFGIVGESGAGKSTFLDLCVGLSEPTAGEVLVFGQKIAGISTEQLRDLRQQIGVVFQGDSLLNNKTVRANLELPLKIAGIKDRSRVHDLLEFVGLADRIDDYPSILSGGQRQRIAVARALMNEPKIILFDEPTSALDESSRHDILQLILTTNREFATTCVIVSHDLAAVKAVCERVALFESGSLEEIVKVRNRHSTQNGTYIDHAREFLSE